MKTAYNVHKKDVENLNMLSFQNAIASIRLDDAENTIKSSSEKELKDLAINIFSKVKKTDVQIQNQLADMIEAWSINLNAVAWTEDIKKYCADKNDIRCAYSVRFLNNKQLVIVVDDMSQDSVLEYNMFAFELRDKYPDIYDFMVIDADAFDSLKDEFETCNEVYKRG